MGPAVHRERGDPKNESLIKESLGPYPNWLTAYESPISWVRVEVVLYLGSFPVPWPPLPDFAAPAFPFEIATNASTATPPPYTHRGKGPSFSLRSITAVLP